MIAQLTKEQLTVLIKAKLMNELHGSKVTLTLINHPDCKLLRIKKAIRAKTPETDAVLTSFVELSIKALMAALQEHIEKQVNAALAAQTGQVAKEQVH